MKLLSGLLSFYLVGVCCFFGVLSAEVAQVKPYTEGAVHEAYVTPSTEGGAVIRSISQQPPQPINELIPPQCHSEAIWIAGYWSWNEEIKDFIWISGLWRRVPPNHVWIPGVWKQFGSDWAWLPGFWSAQPLENLHWIADHPLDPREEPIGDAPGNGYFWMPGYWTYEADSKQFSWLAGRWVQLDPEWMYTPAYYLWRPEGYIFIPGYWDLPLELRGCPYSPVLVDRSIRDSVIYLPSLVLQPESILHWCLTHYPDYSLFLFHHFHFHSDFWKTWCCTPPWWNWEACWCFNWSDTWGLWWWWTTPGYPNPFWIGAELSTLIPPPSQKLEAWMRTVVPPAMITPWGAVSPGVLIDAIGGAAPILPSNPEKIQKIYEQVKPDLPYQEHLRPTGKRNPLSLPRPEIGESNFPKDIHVLAPPKPVRIPESYTESPKFVVPKPQTPYPVLPSPPPGYLPAVPKPYGASDSPSYERPAKRKAPSTYVPPKQGNSSSNNLPSRRTDRSSRQLGW